MSDMLLAYRRYARFSGRSRRREYWLFILGVVIGSFVFAALDAALGLGGSATGVADSHGFNYSLNGGLLAGIWSLFNLIPSLSVAVRRLHDTGRTGWWLPVVLVPLLGTIVFLVFMCLDGERGPNRFGADPKAGTGEAYAAA